MLKTPHHEKLGDTARKIETLLSRLQESLPKTVTDAAVQNSLALVLRTGVKDIFSMTSPPDNRALFQEICSDIQNSPHDFKTVIADSLLIAGCGPETLCRWAEKISAPLPIVMPNILKALQTGINIILHETEADAEFRLFYVLADDFYLAAMKAEAGTKWTNVHKAQEPVQEYNDEAVSLRDSIRAQFARLDRRYIILMNEKLRQFKPFLVAADLAPIECHDDPAEMERARAFNSAWNEQKKAEALEYQTGKTGMEEIIERLDTHDFAKMSKIAGMISHARRLYYTSPGAIMTAKLDEKSGVVTNLQVIKPDDPTRH